MTNVYWVRHGPTHARTFVGWSDLPADLSDTARIARLSGYLPDSALVISSDLIRATATADAIAGTRTRLPHDPDLREIHFGDWELKAHDQISDQTTLRAFWDDPGQVRPPNGECWDETSARVSGALARIMRSHPGRDIIAVAHFGAILTQVQRALDLSGYQTFSHRIDNLSVTHLCHQGGRWHARAINHLP